MTAYRRILLKLSGQSLAGPDRFGVHRRTLTEVAKELRGLVDAGYELAIVIGAGNLFRGSEAEGLDRVSADGAGMLATLMNCIILRGALEQLDVPVSLYSSFLVRGIADAFDHRKAEADLAAGRVVILGGGTGHPFFTTDSAAALRAAELSADVLLKATRVNGVFDSDPEKNASAIRFDRLSYTDVIAKELRVMDTAAFALCRDAQIPIVVFNLHEPGNILRASRGEAVGTLIGPGVSTAPRSIETGDES